jgi:hypothetical protein
MEKVKKVALIVVQVQEVAMEVMVAMVMMQTTMEDFSIIKAVVEG